MGLGETVIAILAAGALLVYGTHLIILLFLKGGSKN